MTAARPEQEYLYRDAGPTWDDRDVWQAVAAELQRLPRSHRIFELGCGNGSTAARMAALGFGVVAVDSSESGVRIAQASHPEVTFHVAAAEEDLAARFGRFPVVVSVEVIEHCFSPASFARSIHALLEPNGIAIISTPYHGYLKNLALALAGKVDLHFSPLWEGGHIKFFSVDTLTTLLHDHGLQVERMHRVGRVPLLAKSMIAIARKAATP